MGNNCIIRKRIIIHDTLHWISKHVACAQAGQTEAPLGSLGLHPYELQDILPLSSQETKGIQTAEMRHNKIIDFIC